MTETTSDQQTMTADNRAVANIFVTVITFTIYTVIEMISNRLLYLVFFFAFLGLGIAGFVAEVAVTEHKAMQLSLLATSYRFCAVFVMMVFVVSTIVRDFNDKCLELYLSMQVSRMIYFVGKMIGFILCGLILTLIFSVCLLFHASLGQVLVWMASLAMELAIVASFAFFATLSFNQQITASVFITFFFYILSRLTDAIELVSTSPILAETLGNNIIEFMLSGLELVLPKLSHFTQTDWLVYGGGSETLPIIFASTLIYCVLIGAMSMWDFLRKNL